MEREFVTLPRGVVEQALEALNVATTPLARDRQEVLKAMEALRAALEQPQSEQPAMTPIAQRKLEDLVASGYTISGYSIYHERKHQHGFVTGAGLVGWWQPDGVEYPKPQGEQEPVAWLHKCRKRPDLVELSFRKFEPALVAKGYKSRPLIFGDVAHQLPKRDPLPDHYINGMFSDASLAEGDMFRRFARAVEAAHNIK